jgi:hypothetical protein
MAEPENPNKQLLDAGAKLRTAAKELKTSALQLRQKDDEAQEETADALKEAADKIEKNSQVQADIFLSLRELIELTAQIKRNDERLAQLAKMERLKRLEELRESARQAGQKGAEFGDAGGDRGGSDGGLIARIGAFLANPLTLAAISIAAGAAALGLRGWELGAARRISRMIRNSRAFRALNQFVSDIGSRIVNVFRSIGDFSGRTVARILQPLGAVGRFIGQVSSFITDIAGGVTRFMGSGIGRRIGQFLGNARGFVGRIIGKILWPIGVVMSAIDGITAFRNAEGSMFERIGVGLGAALGDFLGAPLDLLKRGLSWAVGRLFGVEVDEDGNYDESRFLGRLLNRISDFSFENLFGNFIGGAFGFMSDLFTNPRETLGRLWDSFSGGVTNFGQWLWDNTLGGLFNFIGDLFDNIRGAIISIIPRRIRNLLGIEEPSRELSQEEIQGLQEERSGLQTESAAARTRLDELNDPEGELAELQQRQDNRERLTREERRRLRELRDERDNLGLELERLQLQMEDVDRQLPENESSNLNPQSLPLEGVAVPPPTNAARVGEFANRTEEAMRSSPVAVIAPTVNSNQSSTNVNAAVSTGQPASVDPTYLQPIGA